MFTWMNLLVGLEKIFALKGTFNVQGSMLVVESDHLQVVNYIYFMFIQLVLIQD